MRCLLCCAARTPQCFACGKGPAFGSRKAHRLHEYMIQTPRVVVALCSVIFNRAPRTWHRGQYPVGGSAVSVPVCVWATAADEVRRRVEPQPSCSEQLPCKTSHVFICIDRSDQVLSIWRVKLRWRGSYLGHDKIARTLPLPSCSLVQGPCAKTKRAQPQPQKVGCLRLWLI